MAKQLRAVFDHWKQVNCDGVPLYADGHEAQISVLLALVQDGVLEDPTGRSMYTVISAPGAALPIYCCQRGNSVLET